VPSGTGPGSAMNGPAAWPEVEHCVALTRSLAPVCGAEGGTNYISSIVDGVRATVVTVTLPLTVVGVPVTA
jgi:hypothetical protein